MKKNYLFKIRHFFMLLMLSSSAYGIGLNANLSGEKFMWSNAITKQGYIVPSAWSPVSNIRTTTDWIPGTFMSKPKDTLVLKGVGAESVTIDFEVIGVEYGLGQSSGKFSSSNNTPSGYKTCTKNQHIGSTSSVIGYQCIGDTRYNASTSYTPFQFVRPIISVNEKNLISAFVKAKLPSGQYTGTTFVQPFYAFKSTTGTWTYRQVISVPVSLSITYVTSTLSNIIVSGKEVIEPIYNNEAMTVSGSTYFNIMAQGHFSNGLKMSFVANEGERFELVHERAELDKRIPYNINCDKCEDEIIVLDGDLQIKNSETTIKGSGVESITFQILISYSDIRGSQVETGNYIDTFIVLFEENM